MLFLSWAAFSSQNAQHRIWKAKENGSVGKFSYICITMEVYDDRYNNRTVYIERRTNGLGTAGFVLAVLTIVLGWIPVFGWFTWALGLLFSFIGMFKAPRGLAIAGFVISLLGLIMILFVFALIAAAIGVAGVSSAIVATLF